VLHIIRRPLTIAAATALSCGVLVAPSTASAKTVKFSITTGKLQLAAGGKVSGKASGTFGKGTLTGTVVPPNIKLTFKFKGGTITATSKDAHTAGGNVLGTIRLKGTGRYKKLKGSGKFTGSPATFVFKYTGTATY